METLHWNKDIFGSKLQLKRGNDLIGNIQWSNMLSSKARATINGKLFILNRDFFLSKLEIFDPKDQSLLGTIMVNLFNPRSDVILNGKRFELEINTFWQSRWSWKFDGREIITYKSNEFIFKDKGEINVLTAHSEELEILILLGLFVRNQFILLILIFIVIIFFVIR